MNEEQHPKADKKNRRPEKSREKKSKSRNNNKSSKKDSKYDTNGIKLNNVNAIENNNCEWDVQGPSEERQRDEKRELNRAQDLPSPTLAEAPTPSGKRSSKKGEKGNRRKSDKFSSEKNCDRNNLRDIIESQDKGKNRNRNSNAPKRKGSLRSSVAHSQDSKGRKEDARPLAPCRTTDRHEIDNKNIDKPSSKANIRTNSTKQIEDCEMNTVDGDDKLPIKPKRRSAARRRSPEKDVANGKEGEELGLGSFHTLKLDSDKPRSSSKGRRTPNSARRNKTSAGEKPNRRRLKGKPLDYSDQLPDDKHKIDDKVTQEVDLKDEGNVTQSGIRLRRDHRSNLERTLSNDGDLVTAVSKTSNISRSGKKLSSSKKTGICRSQSERWMRTVEEGEGEGEGGEDQTVIRRRPQKSLNRASGEISRSSHSKIRRHHSTNIYKMNTGLIHRSYHGADSGRHTPSDGRRTPRKPILHHEMIDSDGSLGDDSTDSSGEYAHSQGTLESIDDFEDFGADFYGMNLETPGMVDFDEEMLDLMQRANPEVTEHLDRRVHRKREMVAYDQNMPMMTRQALLTRQASSQVSRRFLDGKNIDKKRLLLRNDSMSSTNSRDELKLSSHRSMRSTHGRRAPPRAKSSGLGAMGQAGYMQSIGGPTRPSELDDRRRVFRSRSSHGGTNQYSQNKPNKVRSLSRRASGDLIQPHTMRGTSRSNDLITHRKSLQKANSTTSLKRPTSSDHAAPRIPERKKSKEKNCVNNDSDIDSEFGSDYESPTSSPKKSLRRESRDPTMLASASSRGKRRDIKNVDKNDMSNKRNRSKLHLLLYKTKMCVDMNVLFKHAREGETPRSPIMTLRMPSP